MSFVSNILAQIGKERFELTGLYYEAMLNPFDCYFEWFPYSILPNNSFPLYIFFALTSFIMEIPTRCIRKAFTLVIAISKPDMKILSWVTGNVM